MAVTAVLMVVELVCVAALVAGVALWSVPAAMVLGGALGVVAVERAQAGRKGTKT